MIKKATNVQATIDDTSGKILHDAKEVNISWYNYFKKLHQPIDSARYYVDNKIFVDKKISEILANDNMTDPPVVFTQSEVKDICKSLKANKAAGFDSVAAEHLKWGGENLYTVLTTIFNFISKHHVVPIHFKKGIVVPIPKGRDKNLLVKDNYRGISLISVVSKVYEKLLLQWFERNCSLSINELQGACLKDTSSINTTLMLRETIGCHGHNGNAVYVCLLDARKAFDTVWFPGLFYKLSKMGCNMHLWRILWDYYQGFESSVFVAGSQSDWFPVKQGVHQGGPFSMKLYIAFNSDLLDELQLTNFGAKLSLPALDLCCPAFADDVSLVTIYKPCMQALLNIADKHSCMWRYDFNSAKSHVLVFGDDTCPNLGLHLGDNTLEIVTVDKHLGVPLTTSRCPSSDIIHERISMGRRSFHASLSLGDKYQPVPPLTLSKLYWAISVPQITYGMELLTINASIEQRLESAHMSVAKIIQGLPRQTSNPAVLVPLQWMTMHDILAYKRLTLLWRILLLPTTSICKQVVMGHVLDIMKKGIVSAPYGPVRAIMESAGEYKLYEHINYSIINGEYMSIKLWKKKCGPALVI